eukprot:GFUD01028592.1.p1 GENE.GFUD01028592.1~~GFUD01028592.1.p1  ORF type:complete len:117 (+),score=32.75 GFUD01028592.1:213-563(+)
MFWCSRSTRKGEESNDLENLKEHNTNWEEVVDGINKDMTLAENSLKAMDAACFGLIPRFCSVGVGFKEDDAVWYEAEQPKDEQLPGAQNHFHDSVHAKAESGILRVKLVKAAAIMT